MALTLDLPEEQERALREVASRLGVEPEQLALAAVADLLSRSEPDFEAAARRVLDENAELYRRLA